MQFKLPHIPGNTKDNISCAGQVMPVPSGKYSGIMFLGCSEFGNFIDKLKLHYEDGTTKNIPFGFTDWAYDPFYNEVIALTGKVAQKLENSTQLLNSNSHLFAKDHPLAKDKSIVSIELPYCPNIHLFALTLAE